MPNPRLDHLARTAGRFAEPWAHDHDGYVRTSKMEPVCRAHTVELAEFICEMKHFALALINRVRMLEKARKDGVI